MEAEYMKPKRPELLWFEGKVISTNPLHLTSTRPISLKFPGLSNYDLWPMQVAHDLIKRQNPRPHP